MANPGTASRIVVALDFSPAADAALAWAAEIAPATGARLWLVHAVPWVLTGAGIVADRLLQRELLCRAEVELARIAKRLRRRGLTVEPHVELGNATTIVAALVTAVGADLVITGTRGRRGLRRLVLGSTAEHLLRELHVPLLVVHEVDRVPTSRPLRLLVGTDLSPDGSAARRSAIGLLSLPAAAVLVHSTADPTGERWFERGDQRQDVVARHLASERLRQEAEELGEQAAVRWVLRDEPPAEAIAAEAREHQADLIAVGARRTSLLTQRTVGSTATRLLQIAPCPVLVSPPTTAAERETGARGERVGASRVRHSRTTSTAPAPAMATATATATATAMATASR